MKGIFIPAHYPNKEIFEQCVSSIVSNGFDFIEIGVPFSEPVADGPVISNAYAKILDSKTKIEDIFKTVENVLLNHSKKIKVFIMTYSNIIFDYGIKEFSKRFEDKLKGLIIADCPNNMQNFFYKKGLSIPIIPFITPESREEDLKFLEKSNANFVYCIGIRGITGAKIENNNENLKTLIKKVKTHTSKPIVLGFGIKTKNDTEFALSIADGFVIGTEAVNHQGNVEDYSEFLRKVNGDL